MEIRFVAVILVGVWVWSVRGLKVPNLMRVNCSDQDIPTPNHWDACLSIDFKKPCGINKDVIMLKKEKKNSVDYNGILKHCKQCLLHVYGNANDPNADLEIFMNGADRTTIHGLLLSGGKTKMIFPECRIDKEGRPRPPIFVQIDCKEIELDKLGELCISVVFEDWNGPQVLVLKQSRQKVWDSVVFLECKGCEVKIVGDVLTENYHVTFKGVKRTPYTRFRVEDGQTSVMYPINPPTGTPIKCEREQLALCSEIDFHDNLGVDNLLCRSIPDIPSEYDCRLVSNIWQRIKISSVKKTDEGISVNLQMRTVFRSNVNSIEVFFGKQYLKE